MSITDLSQFSAEQIKAEFYRREKQKESEEQQKKRAHETKKENFLKETVAKFENYREDLMKLKEQTIIEANKIWNEMYEIQGKEPKEQKQISIKLDNLKITVKRREKFEFTDEAIVHIDAIKDLMKTKFEIRNKGLYSFLDVILMKNGAGDYDPKLLAKAKRKSIELGYEDLTNELEKLQDCQRVNGTALYCRAYKKNERGAWKDIVIQFSSL